VLFLQPRNREQEIWTGRRLGVERAPATLGVDSAHSIEELDALLPKLLRGRDPLHYRTGLRPDLDARVLAMVNALRVRVREQNPAPSRIVDPSLLLHEMRVKKDAHEIAAMLHAAEITAAAHVAAMRATVPAARARDRGAGRGSSGGTARSAPPTRASSRAAPTRPSSTTTRTTGAWRRATSLLLDAGSEFDCYASDVTRTGGSAAASRRRSASVTLVLQAAPGDRRGEAGRQRQRRARRRGAHARRGLRELGLLSGTVDEILRAGRSGASTCIAPGHWLGMVHDVGDRLSAGHPGEHRRLEEGMVVTVEPGLYFAEDDATIPAEYRGIGVRIEDDVLVTATGNEVLTSACPKEIADLESLVGVAGAAAV
jgi:Xaa-Pro aminopeptidase